jgi:hypothetical protein
MSSFTKQEKEKEGKRKNKSKNAASKNKLHFIPFVAGFQFLIFFSNRCFEFDFDVIR